ncbi:hypothetical protein EGY09_07135 [Stenotrophomonas maltophilia]|nr:hypothetical protein EGY09_07135 [Stenotrophomonas maltophilia]
MLLSLLLVTGPREQLNSLDHFGVVSHRSSQAICCFEQDGTNRLSVLKARFIVQRMDALAEGGVQQRDWILASDAERRWQRVLDHLH